MHKLKQNIPLGAREIMLQSQSLREKKINYLDVDNHLLQSRKRNKIIELLDIFFKKKASKRTHG